MVQLKVADEAMHALTRFPEDREIAGIAFTVMGWAMKGPKDRKVRLYLTQNNITALTDKYMELYRIDTYVVGGITLLRNVLTNKIINPTPAMKIKEEVKAVVDSDDDSDDNASVVSVSSTTKSTVVSKK